MDIVSHITGDHPNMEYRKLIAKGGYGEVHKVPDFLPRFAHLVDVSRRGKQGSVTEDPLY
jgi:hypothetical protein